MTLGRHGKDDYMRVYCCTDDLYCNATSMHVCACMPTTHPCNGTIRTATPPRTVPQTTPTHTHPPTHTLYVLTSTQAHSHPHTHKHLDLVQHVSCVVHNDEEWFRLFDGRALEVAVLLVLLLELEEETVVVSAWEAGIRREEER